MRAHRADRARSSPPPASITRVEGPRSASTSLLAPTRSDPIAADGNRLRGRAIRIDGVDTGVVENQVWRWPWPAPATAPRQQQQGPGSSCLHREEPQRATQKGGRRMLDEQHPASSSDDPHALTKTGLVPIVVVLEHFHDVQHHGERTAELLVSIGPERSHQSIGRALRLLPTPPSTPSPRGVIPESTVPLGMPHAPADSRLRMRQTCRSRRDDESGWRRPAEVWARNQGNSITRLGNAKATSWRSASSTNELLSHSVDAHAFLPGTFSRNNRDGYAWEHRAHPQGPRSVQRWRHHRPEQH